MSATKSKRAIDSRPSTEALLAEFGDGDLSVQSLFDFCFVPIGRLSLLKELAVEEDWGVGDVALLKYLAVHIRLAVEQGRFIWNEDQIVMTAGRLRSDSGLPLYIGLVHNNTSDENPWVMNWVGDRPSGPVLPATVDLGVWPQLDPALEIVMGVQLDDFDRVSRIPCLSNLEPHVRSAAFVGACHWAMHQGLAVAHMHAAIRSYFLPVFLEQRADLGAAPDLVCSIFVQPDRILIHSVLDPEVAYAPARALTERADQLPSWLLEAWTLNHAEEGDS